MSENVLAKVQAIGMEMLRQLNQVCEKYDIQYFLAYGSLLGAVRHKGFIPWDDDVDIWMTRDNFQKLCAHLDEFDEKYELVQPEDYGANKYFDSISRFTYKGAHVKRNKEMHDFYGEKLERLRIDVFLIDRTYSDLRGKWQKLELIMLYALCNAYKSKYFPVEHYTPLMHVADKICRVMGRLFPMQWLQKRVAKVAQRYDDRPDTDIYCFTTDSLDGISRIIPGYIFTSAIPSDFGDMQLPIPVGYDAILKLWYGDYMTLPPVEERVPHIGRWDFLEGTQVSLDDFVFETEESEDISK